MPVRSLEDKLQDFKNPVEMLRNAQSGPYPFPIKSEFTNWRDEQEAWRKTAVFFDQSYHMTEHTIEGPDVKRLMERVAVNSMANFGKNRAKQVVLTSPDGYVVGDAIMFILDDHKINIVNKPINRNWVQYHIDTGDFDVTAETDARSVDNAGTRKGFRFEVQGPRAWEILERVNGGPIPDFKFFGLGEINVGPYRVRALRHGMAGAKGLELMGDWALKDEVHDRVMEAGADLGILEGGSRTYSTPAHESGWFPSPLPAIFSGDALKPYREWLPATSFEANMSQGGSFVSDTIEDYYVTPFELGYGHIVKFDHDFVGRTALEAIKDRPHRKKMTLVWNPEDVIRIFASLFEPEERFKYMDMPASHYATVPLDAVMQNGRLVGLSHYPVYTANVRRWISLALLDPEVAVPGTELTLLWGEPDGGTQKPTVERHVQTEVRCRVEPCPISDEARLSYKSWKAS
ncbi:MAG: aminomethyl transferase family protein [Pseudomonadota bacterium]